MWRGISALLSGCWLRWFWGWISCVAAGDGSKEPHPADPCQTCSHFREAFRPKGANKPLFAAGDGEIHGEFNRTEFSACENFRDYNLSSHIIFFPTETHKTDFCREATGFYIRLLLNHNFQILFWLQTASHFLAEDWGKPPSSHMQGHGILSWFLLNCAAPKAGDKSIIYRFQVIRWVNRNHSGFLFSEPKSQNPTNRPWQQTPRVVRIIFGGPPLPPSSAHMAILLQRHSTFHQPGRQKWGESLSFHCACAINFGAAADYHIYASTADARLLHFHPASPLPSSNSSGEGREGAWKFPLKSCLWGMDLSKQRSCLCEHLPCLHIKGKNKKEFQRGALAPPSLFLRAHACAHTGTHVFPCL